MYTWTSFLPLRTKSYVGPTFRGTTYGRQRHVFSISVVFAADHNLGRDSQVHTWFLSDSTLDETSRLPFYRTRRSSFMNDLSTLRSRVHNRRASFAFAPAHRSASSNRLDVAYASAEGDHALATRMSGRNVCYLYLVSCKSGLVTPCESY